MLRRLRDGSIDAAYVGSTLSPEQVAEEEGFHVLAWVGDHFQIPKLVPAMAFALDYLVHDAFNNSDHSIVVTVAGIGSVSGGNRRLRRHPMAQAKLGHVQLPPLSTAAQRLSEAITRVAPLDAGHVLWLASFLGDEPVASRRA